MINLIKSQNNKLTDLSDKILRLNGGEILGKYFRTKLETQSNKGSLKLKVQPIISAYGNPDFKTFNKAASIKPMKTKAMTKLDE